jgi:hypothetical protein
MALQAGRIVQVGQYLRPVAGHYLVDALSTLLLILDEDAATIPAKFADELEVEQFVSDQILEWFVFGSGYDETAVVQELGKALLLSWRLQKGAVFKKDGTIDQGAFMAAWQAKAGDRAESQCKMSLLEVGRSSSWKGSV